jgi:hypothetical protein
VEQTGDRCWGVNSVNDSVEFEAGAEAARRSRRLAGDAEKAEQTDA